MDFHENFIDNRKPKYSESFQKIRGNFFKLLYDKYPGNIEGCTFFIKMMKKAVMIPSMIITGK